MSPVFPPAGVVARGGQHDYRPGFEAGAFTGCVGYSCRALAILGC
jgi:hypothetical protein